MPYCPKCDMEFVEGITVCSDCGGPLVESKEAAETLKKQEQEAEQERKQAELLELQAAYAEALGVDLEELAGLSQRELEAKVRELASLAEGDGLPDGTRPAEPYGAVDRTREAIQAGSRRPGSIPRTRVYGRKSDTYSDLRSSADAFLLVGGVLTAAAVLIWIGFIPFPIRGISGLITQIVLTAMGVGSLVIAWKSFQSAKQVKGQVAEEENATKELIQWFVDHYTGEELDGQLRRESGELSPEELSLKRFDLIQDLLITNHDLGDQAYVDLLAEEIYGKLYED